jgi:hypothetical protein
VRYVAQQLFDAFCLVLLSPQSPMKKREEEITIEGMLTLRSAHHMQTVTQIIGITVEQPFMLQEIGKHETIEHE